jgi:hypothetical protein
VIVRCGKGGRLIASGTARGPSGTERHIMAVIGFLRGQVGEGDLAGFAKVWVGDVRGWMFLWSRSVH